MNKHPSGEGFEATTIDGRPKLWRVGGTGMAMGPSHVVVEWQGWDTKKLETQMLNTKWSRGPPKCPNYPCLKSVFDDEHMGRLLRQ